LRPLFGTMSTFFFYEPNGSANRFSNKERFRPRPNPQARVPVDRDVIGISEPTSDSSRGMIHAANKTLQTLPPESPFQRENSSSTSAMGDDCFDEALMSDGGDSLRSLFSDFTDDRLGDADCNSVNGLVMPLTHQPNATVSRAATHNDANPTPGEFSGFEQPQPATGSAPFAAGRGRRDSTDHIDAQPVFSSIRIPPISRFTESHQDSATFADPIHNDLAVVDPVDITYIEAGTQTDHPYATVSDRGMQTDSAEATNSKEGRPFPVVETCESQDNSYEQHDEHVGNQRHINATDSIETNRQNIPDLVPTLSACPHYHVTRPVVDATHRGHHLPIHGFFTVHGNTDQLAYTLTFFEATAESSSESTYGRTSSLARNDAVERLSIVPDLTVHGDDDDKDFAAFDPPLKADASNRSPSTDRSATQHHYVSQGQKGDRFSYEDNALLVQLKGEGLSWKTIATFFPGRSGGSLQSHYCTKLKRSLPENGRDWKRARTASRQHLDDEEASQQLQCELDWIA
jgi:hypothetical protein